jgi:hypothetical protein
MKVLGWCALCVCVGGVAVSTLSLGGQSATQPASQSTAVPSTKITFLSVNGASPGGYASVTIQTNPGADCSIRYVTPHGTISQARGLENQSADADGKVSWNWKIGSKTEPGNGGVTVTCNGQSATADITIEP